MLASKFSLFYATDLHGSEKCFRKFVESAQFYRANALFLGGDLAGKSVVSVFRTSHGNWVREEQGGRRHEMSDSEARDYERIVRNKGQYVTREPPETLARMDATDRDALFRRLATERLREWFDYAATRLGPSRITVYAIAGNDDPFDFDAILSSYEFVRFLDADALEIAPSIWLVGLGGSNPTPWKTYREYTDDQIALRLNMALAAVPSGAATLFHCHTPPLGSGLDVGPVLDSTLTIQVGAGGQKMAPVGSIAVRRTIESRQPFLGLFGHVHESRAVTRLGSTLCVNPGSQYWTGTLLGFWATIDRHRVVDWRLTEG